MWRLDWRPAHRAVHIFHSSDVWEMSVLEKEYRWKSMTVACLMLDAWVDCASANDSLHECGYYICHIYMTYELVHIYIYTRGIPYSTVRTKLSGF